MSSLLILSFALKTDIRGENMHDRQKYRLLRQCFLIIAFCIALIVINMNIDFVTKKSQSGTEDDDGALPVIKTGTETDEIPTITNPEIKACMLSVPYIYQGEYWPNGCESVSAVMVLQYYGFGIDVDSFIEGYLPCGEEPIVGYLGPDPAEVYCGNPYDQESGWGCYASVIEASLKQYLNAEEYSVFCPNGQTVEELCKEYLNNDIPVILWATLGMSDRTDAEIYAYWQTKEGKPIWYHMELHCLVLCGYDEQYYYFNDPLNYNDGDCVFYPKEDVQRAYEIMGAQCVVVVPDGIDATIS